MATIVEDLQNEGDEEEGLRFESTATYDLLARLSGQNTMGEVLDIFAQKIISNLMTSAESDEEEDKRIVDLSLEVFSNYITHN